jgi:hypothetical protein
MTSSETVPDTSRAAGAKTGTESQDDVLAALAGKSADRQREVARTARRVVQTSLGIMNEQKADRTRSRALALAAAIVVLIVVGPPLWWLADMLVEDERVTNLTGEIGVWAFFLLTALLGSALVAGWVRNRR